MRPDEWHPDWITPQWPAPPHVHSVCSTRAGGVSGAPFDSFNLGDHVGDVPDDVAANRARFEQALGARPVFLSQVHGFDVLALKANTPNGCVADACLTDQTGVVCTLMVADCLPVLLTTRHGHWVAAVHVGWRGLAGPGGMGIIEQTLRQIMAVTPVKPACVATEIIAWLGPCIGPKAFEVGEDVRSKLTVHSRLTHDRFKPLSENKWLADLSGLVRLRLQSMGITQIFGNDATAAWCTASNPSRFFSHRRDGISGRFAVGIWLTDHETHNFAYE